MTKKKKLRGVGGQEKPFVVRADDMTGLWTRLNDKLLWATKDDLVYYSSLDTMIADGLGISESGDFNLNIGQDLWLTPSRWTTLIRQYVDPERLFQWLDAIRDISTWKRGIAAMDMNVVQKTIVTSNPRANRRKHGGCMRMITYRAFPQPTVSLYSRTSYLGYIGGLDMLLAHKLIEMAADMIGEGLQPADFAFRWHCEVYQFHGFKSMSYIFASGQDKFMTKKKYKYLEEEYPTWKLVRNWWDRLARQDQEGKLYEEMKYSAEKRIRRRYHAQQGVDQTPFLGREKPYVVLSTPVEDVSLDRMLYKTPESRAVIRRQKEERTKKLLQVIFDDDTWLEEVG